MKTIKKFVKENEVDYNNLPYSGENEIDNDATAKKTWLSLGVASIKELAKLSGGISINVSKNPSGSIDRGYVSGFISSQDGTKIIYISIGDGMNNLLFRTAEHGKDYTGGSNNTESISEHGFEKAIEFIKNNI